MASRLRTSVVLLVIAVFIGSCAPRRHRPPSDEVVYREEGIASWYGSKFHGRKTSSGERYNMHALTAAHRTLPLDTVARVTHIESGRQVTVKINDRGPFIEGRIIDLSYGAARRLGMVKEGIAPVAVETFAGGKGSHFPVPSGTFSVQAGSFLEHENAERLLSELKEEHPDVSLITFHDNRKTYYRVRVGRFSTREEAARTSRQLERKNYRNFIVRED